MTINNTQITASATAAGKTRAEILIARDEFNALPCAACYESGERDNYEFFYAEKLQQEAGELEAIEDAWIARQVRSVKLPDDGVRVSVATAKALLKNTRLTVCDVSGSSSYGYAYAVCLNENETQLVKSKTEKVDGGWAEQFSLSQLEAIIPAVSEAASRLPRIIAADIMTNTKSQQRLN